MICSSKNYQASRRKNAFRLALIFALTSNASLALADSGFDRPTQAVASCELPEYPFPTATQSPNGVQPISKRVIVRLLGISGSNKLAPGKSTVNSVAAGENDSVAQAVAVQLPALPDMPILPDMPTLTDASESRNPHSMPALPSVATAPMPVPAMPTPASPVKLASAQPQVAMSTMPKNSEVVAANATLVVQSQLNSEESTTAQSGQGSSDALDLISSLDDLLSAATSDVEPTVSGFSDSIQIEYGSEVNSPAKEPGVSLSLSDRNDAIESKQGRAPELVHIKPPTALRAQQPQPLSETVVAIPTITQFPTSLMPQSVEQPYTGTASTGSSRREQKPEAMNIRIEGGAETVNLPARKPLVPLLASATSPAQRAELAPTDRVSPPKLNPLSDLVSLPTRGTPVSQPVESEITVTAKDSVSLQTTEAIQALSVENQEICQVIQTGSKNYSVIGLRPGETRVAIVTEPNGQRKVQIHQVKVGAVQASGQDAGAIAKDISQTIRQLYPRSKVQFTTRGAQLVVSGNVDSEDTAKKILRLVRKTTLAPVVDELRVD